MLVSSQLMLTNTLAQIQTLKTQRHPHLLLQLLTLKFKISKVLDLLQRGSLKKQVLFL